MSFVIIASKRAWGRTAYNYQKIPDLNGINSKTKNGFLQIL